MHAAVGTTVRVTEAFRALFEVRWILSTSGDTVDLSDAEDEAGFDSSLYKAVERPGYNFTGWRIDVGVQW